MRKLCFTAFDNGVTHFDLANNYGPEPGSAEENLGRIVKAKFHAISRRADHQHESRIRDVERPLMETGAAANTCLQASIRALHAWDFRM